MNLDQLKLHAVRLLSDAIVIRGDEFYWNDGCGFPAEEIVSRDWHFIANLLEKKLTDNQRIEWARNLCQRVAGHGIGAGLMASYEDRLPVVIRILQPELFTES